MKKKSGAFILFAAFVLIPAFILSGCNSDKMNGAKDQPAQEETGQTQRTDDGSAQDKPDEEKPSPDNTAKDPDTGKPGEKTERDSDRTYYGVFVSAAKDRDSCASAEARLSDKGFDSTVVYTPDYQELNPEPYYAVTAGLYETEEEADACLRKVKEAGFGDAYVKFTGKYIGDKVCYTMYGTEKIEINKDRVILHDVDVSIPSKPDGEPEKMTLYIDENTKFDKGCELSGFGNYEKGDTPYKWFIRNYDLLKTDPDAYMSNGPALSGVFEVKLNGGHVEAYYGSYWWD